jgi:hemerythrin-like domain-containing protein
VQRPAAVEVILNEHAALAALLKSIETVVESGSRQEPSDFFDAVAAMLFYLDEFPERSHHPMESNLLFPMLLQAKPDLGALIRKLEIDHVAGEGRIRELQHLLLAWRFLGDARREAFVEALREYVSFYLKHMSVEESELLPLVAQLAPEQRAQIDSAFAEAMDPLAGGKTQALYAGLLEGIGQRIRAPTGAGATSSYSSREGRNCG